MSETTIGEVTETTSTSFVAECLSVPTSAEPTLHDPPDLGAFVRVVAAWPRSVDSVEATDHDPFAQIGQQQNTPTSHFPAATYGVVFGAATVSLDGTRKPSALGFPDWDELRREQPQIFELMRTRFSVYTIAHHAGEGGDLQRRLPPRPPRLHTRVYPCTDEEIRALTDDLGFLRPVLLSAGGALAGAPTDELAAACIRGGVAVRGGSADYKLMAGRVVARYLSDDYERLQAILRNL